MSLVSIPVDKIGKASSPRLSLKISNKDPDDSEFVTFGFCVSTMIPSVEIVSEVLPKLLTAYTLI